MLEVICHSESATADEEYNWNKLYPSLKYSGWQGYPKKFGLIKRRITPDAHNKAIHITTLIIIFLPSAALPTEIIIPQITINTKQTIRITETNILVRLHINTGNAVASVTFVVLPVESSCEPNSIQLPMKGTLVLSETPQQVTEGSQTHSLSTQWVLGSLVLHTVSSAQSVLTDVCSTHFESSCAEEKLPAKKEIHKRVRIQTLIILFMEERNRINLISCFTLYASCFGLSNSFIISFTIAPSTWPL